MNYDDNTYEDHDIDQHVPAWMRWGSVVIVALGVIAFFALGSWVLIFGGRS